MNERHRVDQESASTKRDVIVLGLRRKILSRELDRGERLRQDQVADWFNASITPVREARASSRPRVSSPPKLTAASASPASTSTASNPSMSPESSPRPSPSHVRPHGSPGTSCARPNVCSRPSTRRAPTVIHWDATPATRSSTSSSTTAAACPRCATISPLAGAPSPGISHSTARRDSTRCTPNISRSSTPSATSIRTRRRATSAITSRTASSAWPSRRRARSVPRPFDFDTD